MTMEERIGYLLRAASRAEDEGDPRVALALRRMAEEARPLEAWAPQQDSGLGSCTE